MSKKEALLRHNIRMQVRTIDVMIKALEQVKAVLQNDTSSPEPLIELKKKIEAAKVLYGRMVEEAASIIALDESE